MAPPAGDFGQAARSAAWGLRAEGFLRRLLPEVWDGRRWAGWLDTRRVAVPGESQRRCDAVALFERRAGNGPPTAARVEFQSKPRGDMPERQDESLPCLRRELPSHRHTHVSSEGAAVLVNLTGRAQPETWSIALVTARRKGGDPPSLRVT